MMKLGNKRRVIRKENEMWKSRKNDWVNGRE